MCVGISSSDCLMQKIFFEMHFEQNQIRYDNPFLIFGLFLYITKQTSTVFPDNVDYYLAPWMNILPFALRKAIHRPSGANLTFRPT